MDLNLKGKKYIVTGSTSGLGYAVLKALVNEKAFVYAIARSQDNIAKLNEEFGNSIKAIAGDIISFDSIDKLLELTENEVIDGVFINAGGPPAKAFMETNIDDWDNAYNSLLRWKIQLVQKILPKFLNQGNGSILFSESSTVKQPLQNLVLSNSIRLAVVGMAKTLSEEVAGSGINVNIIAPGYHDTAAMHRLFVKKSEVENISVEDARKVFESHTKTNSLGNPDDFASLAAWLLSPKSKYITGQTFSVDGGIIKGTFG
jgi:3-oxoacyl-[acyl-carrier protein] reductase